MEAENVEERLAFLEDQVAKLTQQLELLVMRQRNERPPVRDRPERDPYPERNPYRRPERDPYPSRRWDRSFYGGSLR